MNENTTFCPLSSADSRDADLYFGHLGVAAESALPNQERETQIALCWLSAHVAHQKARLWKARIDGIHINGRDVGNWKVSARTMPGKKEPISLERRRTLMEDGRQITSLAHPFLDGKSRHQALDDLVTFATIQICSNSGKNGARFSVRDMNGTTIHFKTRRIRKKMLDFLHLYQRIETSFKNFFKKCFF